MADKAKSKLLDACRAALRIPAFCNDFDEEIADVIDAARAELVAGGVLPEKANDDSDAAFALPSRYTSRPISAWTTQMQTVSRSRSNACSPP